MDFFTQPKGSTIGVLKDGRTVEEAILDLTENTSRDVSPFKFGAKGDGVTDDSAAFKLADAEAEALGVIIDGKGAKYALGAPVLLRCGGTINAQFVPASGFGGVGPYWQTPSSGRVLIDNVAVTGFKSGGSKVLRGSYVGIPSVNLSNSHFDNNGSIQRTTITSPTNTAQDLVLNVVSTTGFSAGNMIWVGDSKMTIESLTATTITLVAGPSGGPATLPGGTGVGRYGVGQYVTKDSDGKNGLTVGDGGPTFNLSVSGLCSFRGNAWFGLFNWANGEPDHMSTVSVTDANASDNGYIGIGLGKIYTGRVSSNVVSRNGNNGIDLNKASGAVTISDNTTTGNGVDGIFTGSYVTSPDVVGNVSSGNFRIGILYSGDAGGAVGANISGNTVRDNPMYGICVTGVQRVSIDGNTFGGTSGMHLKVEGRNNNPHPNPIVTGNVFETEGTTSSVDMNVGGYTNGGSAGVVVMANNLYTTNLPKITIVGYDRSRSMSVPEFYLKTSTAAGVESSQEVSIEARNPFNTSLVDVVAGSVVLQFTNNTTAGAAAQVTSANRLEGVELYNGATTNGRIHVSLVYGKAKYRIASSSTVYLFIAHGPMRDVVTIPF